jgi:hypothetical protein
MNTAYNEDLGQGVLDAIGKLYELAFQIDHQELDPLIKWVDRRFEQYHWLLLSFVRVIGPSSKEFISKCDDPYMAEAVIREISALIMAYYPQAQSAS